MKISDYHDRRTDAMDIPTLGCFHILQSLRATYQLLDADTVLPWRIAAVCLFELPRHPRRPHRQVVIDERELKSDIFPPETGK